MTDAPAAVGTSVRARLLRLSRERGEDFQLVLTRYANERLLYRLAQSPHGSRFVLKGAALFLLWTGAPHRATRDIDLLGHGDPGEEGLRSVFTEVLATEVPEDGLHFDADTLQVGPIREEQAYGGIRLVLTAHLTTARVRLQVDVGFGDAVTPEAEEADFPVLLDHPAPRLRVYPPETVVAEKLEALVQLGLANSRMKDFHDLAVLARTFSFDGALLARAIQATFARRGTPLPGKPPVAFTEEFSTDSAKRTQWAGFERKSGAASLGTLESVVAEVAHFLEAPLEAATGSAPFVKRWAPRGPWS